MHSKDESELRESSKTTTRAFWGILPLEIQELLRKGVHPGALKCIMTLYRLRNDAPMLPASMSKAQNPPSNPTNTCALQREEREKETTIYEFARWSIEDPELQNKPVALTDVVLELCNVRKKNALVRAARNLCTIIKNKGEKLCSSAPTGETTRSHTKPRELCTDRGKVARAHEKLQSYRS
jgi:hypothetical protein